MNKYNYIGRNIPKPDAYDKVTGRAKYAGDLTMEGMLYGRAVRSPHAWADILSIDAEEAERYPGVVCVLTAKDVPGVNKIGMCGTKDIPVLADGRVLFHQQAVAVIAAETLAAVDAAAALVRVEYAPRTPLTDPMAAMAPDAPQLHVDKPGNICIKKLTEHGNVETAMAAADVIVTREYRTQMVEHGYIEPEASLSYPEGDGVFIWSATKSAHLDQAEISRVLGLPKEKVHVRVPYIGGSFGGKSDLPLNGMTALLAMKTGRPVRMTYKREESMRVSTKRHPMILRYTHGARWDGTIVAVEGEIIADSGAYEGYSPAVLSRTVLHGSGPYNIPNVRMQAVSVFTNNPTTGAMRGFGVPQVAFACERQIDILAARLGMDPMELRLKNAMRPGDIMPSGQAATSSTSYYEALLTAREKMLEDVQEHPLAPDEAWGYAGHYYGNGRTANLNPGSCVIYLEPDGKVLVTVGSPDIGQGSNTLILQLVSTVLNIGCEHISVFSGDSIQTLDSGTTSGTRLTAVVCRGVVDTARDFKEKLLEGARNLFGTPATLLEEGLVGGGGNILSLQELYEELKARGERLRVEGRYDPPTTPLNAKSQGIPYATYTYGVQCVRVKVDEGTGKVTPTRLIASYDIGTPLAPQMLSAQVEGGAVGGLGYALLEEIELQDSVVKNANFDKYLIPTCLDTCPIDSYYTGSFEPEGPFGAKGIGEPALIPTAAAVANAVSRITGREQNELPVSLERVIRYDT